MNSTEKLFADFPGLTQKQWKEKAIDDLKGADYEKSWSGKQMMAFRCSLFIQLKI